MSFLCTHDFLFGQVAHQFYSSERESDILKVVCDFGLLRQTLRIFKIIGKNAKPVIVSDFKRNFTEQIKKKKKN
jgi:hypothetical protein